MRDQCSEKRGEQNSGYVCTSYVVAGGPPALRWDAGELGEGNSLGALRLTVRRDFGLCESYTALH